MYIIVNVTDKHISQGVRLGISSCPVYLAMNECVKVRLCFQTNYQLECDPPSFFKGHKFPPAVTKAIQDFDRSGKMVPFYFRLRLPANMVR